MFVPRLILLVLYIISQFNVPWVTKHHKTTNLRQRDSIANGKFTDKKFRGLRKGEEDIAVIFCIFRPSVSVLFSTRLTGPHLSMSSIVEQFTKNLKIFLSFPHTTNPLWKQKSDDYPTGSWNFGRCRINWLLISRTDFWKLNRFSCRNWFVCKLFTNKIPIQERIGNLSIVVNK